MTITIPANTLKLGTTVIIRSTPDFEKIARAVARKHADQTDEDGDGNIVDLAPSEDNLTEDIAAALRQVWDEAIKSR